jgi:hypothetical protein
MWVSISVLRPDRECKEKTAVSESHASEHVQTTPTASSAHGHEHGSATSGFSDAEVSAMHADDVAAAGHIVKLMIGIFLGGVLLYSIVDLICARG